MLINVLKIVQIITAVLLTASILLQGKGGGLSSAYSSSFTAYSTKRGAERVIFITTIVCVIVLVVNSLYIIKIS